MFKNKNFKSKDYEQKSVFYVLHVMH